MIVAYFMKTVLVWNLYLLQNTFDFSFNHSRIVLKSHCHNKWNYKVGHIVDSGLVTPSGLTSVPIGVETPDMIELRKKRIEDAMDQGGDTPALYTILPEKKTAVGAAMMGSAHVYDLSAVSGLILT